MVLLLVALLSVPVVGTVLSSESDGADFTSYYDQLNENGKAIYDAMESADADTHELTILLPVALSFSSETADQAKGYLEDTVKETINDACIALKLESPFSYWGWNASIVVSDNNIAVSGNTASVTTVHLSVLFINYPVDPDTGEFGGIQPYIDAMHEAVDKFSTKSTSVRDKVLDINNYLVDLITYDPNVGTESESVFTHDAYGALADTNHYAVCDGYSKAFLLLCEKEGIESVVVLGSSVPNMVGHAWNYVKMDNGQWYAIDVTWNDSNNGNIYFLLGGNTFFTTHQQGMYLSGGMKTYTFDSPPLSATAYDSGGPDYSDYAWILAAAITAIIAISLFKFAKGSK